MITIIIFFSPEFWEVSFCFLFFVFCFFKGSREESKLVCLCQPLERFGGVDKMIDVMF